MSHSSARLHALARPDDRPVDPWAVLTGGSVVIVAGFIADLLRLGIHAARRAIAAPAARRPCTSHR